MTDQEQEPWQEPWPEKMYLLHPSIKTFGAMVSNPERREYVRADRIEELEREIQTLTTAGIIEVAVRNPCVMGYMKHWEDRAEAAEAKLTKAVEALRGILKGDDMYPWRIAREVLAELEGGEEATDTAWRGRE